VLAAKGITVSYETIRNSGHRYCHLLMNKVNKGVVVNLSNSFPAKLWDFQRNHKFGSAFVSYQALG
jgi:hypothetical protein